MIILASSSPQRSAILRNLGVECTVVPSAVAELACSEQDPAKRAVMLARMKAMDVAASHKGKIVIGCDTLVVSADGTLLEKPSDANDARRMLRLQSGGKSVVHSGLCVIAEDGEVHEGLSSSSVFFRILSDSDIDWWIATGLWKDRSGSFQIDGHGQLLIERIDGEFYSIVGLPVFLLGQLLQKAGHPLVTAL